MLNTVFIFTKPNRMGKAKTRLARDVGYSEARRLNHWMTSRAIRAATDPRWQTALMVTPDAALSAPEPAWGNSHVRLSQGEGDLGDRMARAVDLAPPGKVILLGTDAPAISSALIWQGFQALGPHDAVFGPADDGGFWLFGQIKRTGTRAPFEHCRWSTEHAMADVMGNLSGKRIARLPTMIDLDDGEALRAWRKGQSEDMI